MRFVRPLGMCRAVALAIAWLAAPANAQLAVWDPSGVVDSANPVAVSSTDPDVSASDLTKSPSLLDLIVANTFMAGFWPTGPLDPDKYFEFSVTPDLGLKIVYSDVTFSLRNFAGCCFDGTSDWEVRSSVDGYASALDSGSILSGLPTPGVVVVADVSSLGSVADTVTFRIYTFNNMDTTAFPDRRGITGTSLAGVGLEVNGVVEDVWVQVNAAGFGDSNDFRVGPLSVFATRLYAGTINGDVWRTSDGTSWTQVTTLPGRAFLGAVFGNQLYAGTQASGVDVGVWRSLDGTSWTQVVSSGFGDATNSQVNPDSVFGAHLYAGTGKNLGGGGEVWRSSDGTSWTQVNSDGFGDANNTEILLGPVFGGHLYAGTRNAATGGEIWRTADGTSWTQVNTDGFGDSNNEYVQPTAVFGGFLYAGTADFFSGGEIWRSADGTSWSQVDTNGFGNPANVVTDPRLAVGDVLYALTANDVPTGGEVWSTEDGTQWEQISTGGFGAFTNFRFVDAAAFGSHVYVSTETVGPPFGGEVWRAVPEPGGLLPLVSGGALLVLLARRRRRL